MSPVLQSVASNQYLLKLEKKSINVENLACDLIKHVNFFNKPYGKVYKAFKSF